MSKTEEEYQLAIDDIREVCKKHGIFLLGTCYTEGIYGEITIGDSYDPGPCGWIGYKSVLDNTVIHSYITGIFEVSGIGDIEDD